MPYTYPITIHHIFISPGHNYFGNRTQTPGLHPTLDVAMAEVKAGLGLVGDRFYGKGENFDGHVTFFAWEVFQALQAEFEMPEVTPVVSRRNVITECVPLNQLIGQEFTID
ncbi:MAG: molybdenum cofactor biosysynthesis protein, partial [Chloroflexi bacterium]|nr:molybdenum cofactor biosysynthesis protein [Chloroflexota bacterium]